MSGSAASCLGSGCSCSCGANVAASATATLVMVSVRVASTKLTLGNGRVIRFRYHRPSSSGKGAHVPQLSTLQGIFEFGKRKNLPTHGYIQRHSQRRRSTNVSLESLLAAAAATSVNCICCRSLPRLTADSSLASAGISTFSVREPGWSIGPQSQSASLSSTETPASAWRRCSSSISSSDASSSRTHNEKRRIVFLF